MFYRLLMSVVIGSLLIFAGCFPTNTDTGNNPVQHSDPISIDDDPADLPVDIDPNANTSDVGIDSMFKVLVERVESMESVGSIPEFYALDFSSLRRGFGAAIRNDPDHVKANVGFMVSTVLSLNASDSIQGLIDSIDVFVSSANNYYGSEPQPVSYSAKSLAATDGVAKQQSLVVSQGLFGRIYRKHGLTRTGNAMMAELPKLLKAHQQKPAFPRFVTISYIQNTIETCLLPRLNEVVAAAKRIENRSDGGAMNLTVSGESYELDKGDICLLDAGVRAARAMFSLFLVYDMDLHSPDGATDMRWIDRLLEDLDTARYRETLVYSLNGDTLQRSYVLDATSSTEYLCDVYQHNLQRTGFLTIRKQYHAVAYNDLKAVPVLIKTGIALIKNETDNQDDDLLITTDVFNTNADMASFSSDMVNEGFTPAFADNFSSLEKLMDFVSKVLDGPYLFNETVDGISVSIEVDISQFFTNPPNPLSDLWPRHRFPKGQDRHVGTSTGYVEPYYSYYGSQFSYDADYYDEVRVEIPASGIDSVYESWGTTVVTLSSPISYRRRIDSVITCAAIIYVDDKGNDVPMQDFLSINDAESLARSFPYYDDYTFGGIFPKMTTRQKWIDFFSSFLQ